MHVVELLDWEWQEKDNEELRRFCAQRRVAGAARRQSVRDAGALLPHAVHEFANEDLDWLIHRQLYQKRIDVLQLEYTRWRNTTASTAGSPAPSSSTTCISSPSGAGWAT